MITKFHSKQRTHFKRILAGSFFLMCVLIGVNATSRNASTETEFNTAVSNSIAGDIINFTDNIVVTGEKFLSKSITINGNGFSISVMNPGLDDMGRFNASPSTYRVATISGTSITVTMNDLTIKGGSILTGLGGGLLVSAGSILHLNNCVVCNSQNPISGGGGIGNSGVIYLYNSMVTRNAAHHGGGFVNSSGGVIYLEKSTFSENRSTSAGGGGGAGENQSGATLYVNNSTISNNQSTEIGGGINNNGGTLYLVNSSLTGNVSYGNTSSFKGGAVGNNGGTVYSVNSLFAHNYHITGGTVANPTSYELDDIVAYNGQNRVYMYYSIYHAALPALTNNVIGNIQYTGLQNGSNNTIFSGGALSRITDGTGTEIGTATIFRPFLYNNNGETAPTLKSGSFTLLTANKGTQTRFANNGNVSPVVAYYNRTTSAWVNLLNTATTLQLITSDQVGTSRNNPPAIGAIEGVTDNLYMVKVNAATNGTVNGGTIYGDVYPSGTEVTITALPTNGYSFVRWDYVSGGTGIASTSNPFSLTVTSDITIVPVFQTAAINSYVITYVGNQNTDGDAPATNSYSAATTIQGAETLVRDGYNFKGWNTNANGSGLAYAAGDTYSAGINLTLYANWTTTPAIISTSVSGLLLASATLGATISPTDVTVLDRGICWKATSGVTISDHKISAGGLTGGTYSVGSGTLPRSSTIYFKGYVTTYAGTVLSAESSFSNVPVFSGTGSWSDPTKWNVNEVPGQPFSNGLLDYPVIAGNCTLDYAASGYDLCNSLTINAGAVLTINPAQSLKVMGALVNNANAEGLVIKSDPVLVNGSLAFAGGTPQATVEMFSKASWDLKQATGSKYSWQYFSVPVKSLPYSDSFSSCYVRQFDETSGTDADLWNMIDVGSTLTAGTGYELVQSDPTKYSFAGELTNTSFHQTLNYTTGAEYPGQHIFGNPYTMAIDIKQITFGSNTEQAVYLYNSGTYNQWSDNGGASTYSGTTTIPGQYTVTTPNTVGDLDVPTQIPSMQGFLVKAMNEQGGSIDISYQNLILNAEMQRVSGTVNTGVTDKVVTRIDLTGTHLADRMWLFTDPTCTRNYDNGWDGAKILTSATTPQLYASEATGKYQIDALSDINQTMLGFQAGQDTLFTLTFTHKNLESKYTKLYMVDLLENKTVDVTATGSEYAFTAVANSNATNRFKLVAVAANQSGTPELKRVKITDTAEAVIVQNLSALPGNYGIYNLAGLLVGEGIIAPNNITTISKLNLDRGAYVVKASTDFEKTTQKILIR